MSFWGSEPQAFIFRVGKAPQASLAMAKKVATSGDAGHNRAKAVLRRVNRSLSKLGSCVVLICRGEEARCPLLARTKPWVLTS